MEQIFKQTMTLRHLSLFLVGLCSLLVACKDPRLPLPGKLHPVKVSSEVCPIIKTCFVPGEDCTR